MLSETETRQHHIIVSLKMLVTTYPVHTVHPVKSHVDNEPGLCQSSSVRETQQMINIEVTVSETFTPSISDDKQLPANNISEIRHLPAKHMNGHLPSNNHDTDYFSHNFERDILETEDDEQAERREINPCTDQSQLTNGLKHG